tara:strand:- start:223 stop:324 length:102 start_codon:yes stop_codon:yes gene_type:complete
MIDYIGVVGVFFFFILSVIVLKASIEGENPYEK